MKIVIGALALLIAAPVVAQSAPATDPHAGHAQHQQQGTADHSQHKGSGDHSQHSGDCCKDAAKHKECCEQAAGKQMKCCEKDGKPAAAHEGHSGH